MMTICIDARVINKYPGLGRACRNLLRGIAQLDNKNTYIILGSPSSLNFLEKHPNFQIREVKFPVLSLRTLLWLNRIISRERVDIFHSPFQVSTIFPPCPMVITVHDMMDLFYKDAFSHHNFLIETGLRSYFRFAIPRTLSRACKIISVSESTKKDMIKYLRIPDDKIEVILNGVEESFQITEDEKHREKVREKYNLPDQYILYLGSTKAYKNLDNSLEAFAVFKNLCQEKDLFLVIAGLRHFARSNLYEKIKKYGIESATSIIGYVAEEDLPVVYGMSELFLFPSLWEGFGLPVLEAMASGVPVVTSVTSSLPEVAGDAGILVNPEDPGAIARGIQKVLENSDLKRELVKKGLDHAKTFSWEKAARKTLRIYQETAEME